VTKGTTVDSVFLQKNHREPKITYLYLEALVKIDNFSSRHFVDTKSNLLVSDENFFAVRPPKIL
jgi:hypothetical protein